MDLNSPKIIKELLAKYETRPSKGLGQNFLIDAHVLEKIINSAEIKPSDTILEVGPGLGTLTKALAEKAGKVIAIEKDETMVKALKETLKDFSNVQIENCDILEFIGNWKLKTESYKVVANIPYYLTSPLIRMFLEAKKRPDFMVLMIQKEVAQRICAEPPKMSILSVSVQFYAEPKIISYVSKNCFYPAPKIDSAIIKISPSSGLGETGGDRVSPGLFFRIVKAGFSQPRKKLASNLSKILKLKKEEVSIWLKKNNIQPTQRAETLTIENWSNLATSSPDLDKNA